MLDRPQLLLRADTPDLLRFCSPVRPYDSTSFANRWSVLQVGTRYLTIGRYDAMERRAMASCFGLDLKDATGRMHAALWLADRLHPNDGPYVAACVVPGRVLGPLEFGIATVSIEEGSRWRCFSDWEVCEGLDPLDPRTLEDGSRWVDAEALRRMCERIREAL